MTFKHTLLGLSLLGLSASGFAQTLDRSKLPADAPAPQIKIGKPETFTLPNGLKVFVVENHKLPRVAVNLVLDRDPLFEGDIAGVSSFAGQLIRNGTKTRTKEQLDEEIDFIGADISTSPTNVSGRSLSKNVGKLFELMSDVVLNPAFPQAELDKLKKQTKSGLASQKDNPNAIATKVANVVMFGKNHPYGEQMTEETVDKVTMADVKSYYNTYFRPNIGYLAVVGDITAAQAKTLVEKAFGGWQRADVPKPTYPAPASIGKTRIALVDRPSSVQSVISVVYPVALKPYSQETILASVMNDILGGSEARLFNNLREKHGYTYGAYSNLSGDRLIGRFRASASVRNAVTDSSVAEIMNELKSISTMPVTAAELKQTKNAFGGNFIFTLEDPQTVANFAINTARYNLPTDFFPNYLKYVDAITEADVASAGKQFIRPENAIIVVVGKASEIADKLKRFGDIEYFDTKGNPVAAPQAAKAIPVGLNAQQVIDKYITAIGGKEALMKIQDMSMQMSTEVQGTPVKMSRLDKAPNKSVMAVTVMGNEMMKMVSDGQQAARIVRGNKTALSGKDADQQLVQDGLFPELYYAANKVTSTLDGTEKVDGKDTFKVKNTTANGHTWTDFFDATTGLKTQTMSMQKGPQGEVAQIISYGDYKAVNGVLIPYQIKQPMGPMTLTLSVDKVEVNKGLKDTDFSVN
ncbi:insulinase family protein [Fibrella forsythiae]|uniref:Insulinase family protein n=1 Tax=Fibrella forsythiae TaxID=2817061 RepID=A0ABS3JHD9_9BACT|nr:insulinase family protein [Fibrella forsythiae]MBO0948826.1 insulinase family protein [Fibrella forsythiae]